MALLRGLTRWAVPDRGCAGEGGRGSGRDRARRARETPRWLPNEGFLDLGRPISEHRKSLEPHLVPGPLAEALRGRHRDGRPAARVDELSQVVSTLRVSEATPSKLGVIA